MNLLHEARKMPVDELIFLVGVFVLDNRRLRGLIARMAPAVLDETRPTWTPLSEAELEEIAYTVKCWAEEQGHTELAEQLGKPRSPARRKKRAA